MKSKCIQTIKDALGCDIKLKTQYSAHYPSLISKFPYSKTKRDKTINRMVVHLPQTWNKHVAIFYKIPAQMTLSESMTAQNHICTEQILQYVCKFVWFKKMLTPAKFSFLDSRAALSFFVQAGPSLSTQRSYAF